MPTMTKQQSQQRAAAAKREAKRVAHEAMMARQTARRAAITLYESAFNAWQEANCTGPAPLDPRFYDLALFPENKPVAA
jgi:type II secretory pathway pseudopilin PulG